ncbi:MAG: hypothetical protein JWM11_2851, partial [Planctomycetaceae bacterium]|nr:hypothetical protein [Planctomycetaceae bacterium]
MRCPSSIWVTLPCLCLAFPLLAGCGPSGPTRAAVSGEVMFDNEPIDDGTIVFIPVDTTHGAPTGGRIKDGMYSLAAKDGPVVGTHKIEITANRKTGEKIVAAPPATGEIDKIEQYIPPE